LLVNPLLIFFMLLSNIISRTCLLDIHCSSLLYVFRLNVHEPQIAVGAMAQKQF